MSTSTRFNWKFLRVLSKKSHLGKLYFTFFTKKVSTVIYTEGGEALSRQQNDKTTYFDNFFPPLRHTR